MYHLNGPFSHHTCTNSINIKIHNINSISYKHSAIAIIVYYKPQLCLVIFPINVEVLADLTFSGLSCFQVARARAYYILGSCNVGTHDLPDSYALSPLALSIHTRKITHVYFTTYTYGGGGYKYLGT